MLKSLLLLLVAAATTSFAPRPVLPTTELVEVTVVNTCTDNILAGTGTTAAGATDLLGSVDAGKTAKFRVQKGLFVKVLLFGQSAQSLGKAIKSGQTFTTPCSAAKPVL